MSPTERLLVVGHLQTLRAAPRTSLRAQVRARVLARMREAERRDMTDHEWRAMARWLFFVHLNDRESRRG